MSRHIKTAVGTLHIEEPLVILPGLSIPGLELDAPLDVCSVKGGPTTTVPAGKHDVRCDRADGKIKHQRKS
jgi:hypothetical protein